MKKYTVPFQNKSLNVITNENLGKMAIVLIHGNSLSSKIWGRQFSDGLSKSYHLIAYDIPGHGDSENMDYYNFPLLADSLSTVIDYFELQNYILVGNSLGGDLILQIINNRTDCKGIILIGTPPVGKPPAMDKALLPNPFIGMFFSKDYDSTNLDSWSQILFTDGASIPEFIKPDFIRTDGMVRQCMTETVTTSNYLDEIEAIKNAKVPVCIISGKQEKMVNNEFLKSFQAPTLWKNKIHLIENAAHCPQWENPKEFNAILRDFCSSI